MPFGQVFDKDIPPSSDLVGPKRLRLSNFHPIFKLIHFRTLLLTFYRTEEERIRANPTREF